MIDNQLSVESLISSALIHSNNLLVFPSIKYVTSTGRLTQSGALNTIIISSIIDNGLFHYSTDTSYEVTEQKVKEKCHSCPSSDTKSAIPSKAVFDLID